MNIEKRKPNPIDTVVGKFATDFASGAILADCLTSILENQKTLDNFLAPGKTIIKSQSWLISLRKWNSYTPVLPVNDEEKKSQGGGYFLCHGGVGIVIDPGYDFVANFFRAKFKIDDVDAVCVTHAHDDHTAQLESLFSLLYKCNKKRKEDGLPAKKIDLYMNLGSFKKFSPLFNLAEDDGYVGKITILNAGQSVEIKAAGELHGNGDIEVIATSVAHHETITKQYAVGLTFVLKSEGVTTCKLRFTGDTAWNSALEEENRDIFLVHGVDSVDVLVLHIGSIKECETKYDAGKSMEENKSAFYDKHLGILGSVAVIHHTMPKIALISEFGQEMLNLREEIAKVLGERLKINTLSMDLNFCIDLKTLQIRSYLDKQFYDYADVKSYMHNSNLVYYAPKSLNKEQLRTLADTLNSIKLF